MRNAKPGGRLCHSRALGIRFIIQTSAQALPLSPGMFPRIRERPNPKHKCFGQELLENRNILQIQRLGLLYMIQRKRLNTRETPLGFPI